MTSIVVVAYTVIIDMDMIDHIVNPSAWEICIVFRSECQNPFSIPCKDKIVVCIVVLFVYLFVL